MLQNWISLIALFWKETNKNITQLLTGNWLSVTYALRILSDTFHYLTLLDYSLEFLTSDSCVVSSAVEDLR